MNTLKVLVWTGNCWENPQEHEAAAIRAGAYRYATRQMGARLSDFSGEVIVPGRGTIDFLGGEVEGFSSNLWQVAGEVAVQLAEGKTNGVALGSEWRIVE